MALRTHHKINVWSLGASKLKGLCYPDTLAYRDAISVRKYHTPSLGETLQEFKLHAGDDAGEVTWMAATSKLNLYANHTDFILKVVELRKAAW